MTNAIEIREDCTAMVMDPPNLAWFYTDSRFDALDLAEDSPVDFTGTSELFYWVTAPTCPPNLPPVDLCSFRIQVVRRVKDQA